MAKQTELNRLIWRRNREWCYTCETWVVPIGGKCKACRNTTDPYPEKIDKKHSK